MFNINIIGTGSSGNCCLISDNHTTIMIDAGMPLDMVSAEAKITGLSGVLVTHEHTDHCKYVKALAAVYTRHVYATRGTMGQLEVPLWAQNIVEYGRAFEIGTLRIMPLQMYHDAAQPCGFYIKNEAGETIAWISDTGTLDGVQIEADAYCIEANYDEDILDGRLEGGKLYAGLHARLQSEFGHLSIQQASDWLTQNASDEAHIILLHKSKDNAKTLSAFDKFKNVYMPDERGRLKYSFGIDDRCPF